MPEFITRLIAERDQLKDRLTKLQDFLKSDKFKSVDQIQQSLMIDQEYYMKGYLDVLEKRLNNLN